MLVGKVLPPGKRIGRDAFARADLFAQVDAWITPTWRAIAGLRIPSHATVWGDYAGRNSYQSDEARAKAAFVGEMTAENASQERIMSLIVNE